MRLSEVVCADASSDWEPTFAESGGIASHGGRCHINNWLARHGYLEAEETDSGWQIDWTRTRAVAMGPVHIMLNVADRNPDGIVAAGAEYERLREEIVDRPSFIVPTQKVRVLSRVVHPNGLEPLT